MRFKNLKKKIYKKKSPSNSRTIPVSFKLSLPKVNPVKLFKLYRGVLKVFVAFIFIAAVLIVGYDFQKNLQTKQDIDSQRQILVKDLNFWESFLSKYKGYRDAYFQASILEYRLGNTSKAKIYLEKGLSLDPNSEDGKKIEDFLRNKFYF